MGALENDLDAGLDAIYAKNQKVLKLIENELDSARRKHRNMYSTHEGYAVIKEELDELWDEVKKKRPDMDKLREEAIQVAAMAARFVADLL